MEDLNIANGTKAERYETLLPQIAALVEDEPDPIANMANVAAVLYETFHFWWVGFYRVMGNELVLGPFQGPLACTRIAYGRGVCGTAWAEKRTVIVPNVDEFTGHIACSSLSRSEIVVPIFSSADEKQVLAVLDIDSEKLDTFDKVDQHFLQQIVRLLTDSTLQNLHK